jgi:tRNA-2-methylthio-N6-dimethylallyladenosine synthase
MNKADSERLGKTLASRGYVEAERLEQATVIVLNTCSVRQHAEDRAVGKLHALESLKRRKPEVIIALAGCMVGADSTELANQFPYVDVFLRPTETEPLLELLSRHDGVAGDGENIAQTSRPSPVTAFVPVIYGCDNFCSYCVVPYRRGRERSRPVGEIISEIEGLVAAGVREVTLLGQNVNSYGRGLPDPVDFADLLEAVDAVEGLWRIRFTTSHPKDMTERLVEAIARLPKACEHVNLPVQAGDDEVLQRMRRGYSVETYRQRVAAIRGLMPAAGLTTDVIVGFPGESRSQFENTLGLIAEIGFDAVHLAAFSPRRGTLAARMVDDVPPEEKKARLQTIEEAQTAIATAINARLLDTSVQVLVEGRQKGKWCGRTRSNKLVFFQSDQEWTGKLATVRITRTSPWSLQGEATLPEQDDLDQAA